MSLDLRGVGEPAGPWALRRLKPGLPAAPLTVLSAEAVARRKSSKGEKSKSVTRSVGEKQLTRPDGDQCPVPTHPLPRPEPQPRASWLSLCHTMAAWKSSRGGHLQRPWANTTGPPLPDTGSDLAPGGQGPSIGRLAGWVGSSPGH